MNKTIALNILAIIKQQRQCLIVQRATVAALIDSQVFVNKKILNLSLDSAKELSILQTQIEELETLIATFPE